MLIRMLKLAKNIIQYKNNINVFSSLKVDSVFVSVSFE